MKRQALVEECFREDYRYEADHLYKELSVNGVAHRSSVRGNGETPDRYGWWKAYLNGETPRTSSHDSTEAAHVDTTTRPTTGVLRTVDLFCGAGGLALGTRQAANELGLAFEAVAAADTDKDALGVYEANHGSLLKSSKSVTQIVNFKIRDSRVNATFARPPRIMVPQWRELVGQVDIVLAGPPCQGHSNLNNRTRRDDPRNLLYLTVPALAIALEAPMVLIENVESVVHDRQGVVQTTVQLLRSSGYEVSFGVVNAAALGWPQTRKRFFLVASREQVPIPVRQIADELAATEPRNVMWAIGDLVGQEPDDEMNRLPTMSDDNLRRIKWLHDNNAHDLAIDQRPVSHQDEDVFEERKSVYGRMHVDRPSPTITTGFMTPGRGRYVHPTEPRVLTPNEAARLQGFPDTYCWRLPDGSPPKSQSLAKWIGDAVPMPLGYTAALSILGPLVSQRGAR